MSAASALLCREIKLACRNPAEIATQLLFALLVTSLFPLALGPSPEVLQKLAPGLLSLALLLAQFLGFERLFAEDHEEGTLDIIAASTLSFLVYALVKSAARWITHALPLLLLSPVLAIMLGVLPEKILPMLAALFLTSLIIHLAGMATSALVLGARRGFLLPLLLGPLCIPALIFCAALAESGFDSATGRQAALFLGSLFFLYLCLFPPLAAAGLRSSVEAS